MYRMTLRRITLAVSCLLMLAGQAGAAQVQLDVSLANPILLAGKKQTTYMKTSLTGFELKSEKRAPVNVALVLDKSGSMKGNKIEQAKQAAIDALDRLGSHDIVSVIVYDSTVQVLVPATKLQDRESVKRAIGQVQAGGSTALFAGVSKGAQEVRKFLDEERVNRIILLSDGKANVGPQSPSELGQLGKSLAKENITVSTLGLGLDYHEDLMTKLARQGGGNHVFIEDASQLAAIFNQEFNDVLSVVAQEVVVTIDVADGVRAVKVLGREAEINGQQVIVQMNQLYSEQEKYVMLELEVPVSKAGQIRDVADVELTYANLQTKTTDRVKSEVQVNFSDDVAVVEKNVCQPVMAMCVLQIANERNMLATKLRDQGQTWAAVQLLRENGDFLLKNGELLNCKLLKMRCADNLSQAKSLEQGDWNRTRKQMRELQYRDATQQRVGK